MNARFLLAPVAFVLAGCAGAPQMPVPLSPTVLASPNGRVGVVMTALPKINTSFPGAGCLLCMAAAELNHSALTAHVQKLPYEDLPKLKDQVAQVLANRGHEVRMITSLDIDQLPSFKSDTPNYARKDFKGLKASLGVDRLVVIQVAEVGIERMYSAYIPVAEPKAVVKGLSYMVNLNDNALEWYLPLNVQKASDGAWDEGPSFPGLTNAYHQSLELAKDEIVGPFIK